MSQRAMLVILASVEPRNEVDFNRWYDREHLPDRVTVPGFLGARRYQLVGDGRWKYLALYETENIGIFTSPAYRERLANQSEWSKLVLPKFVQPQRNITVCRARAGAGVGSQLFLAVLKPKEKHEGIPSAVKERATAAMESDPDIVTVAVFESNPVLSKPVAEYPPVSDSPISGEDLFLVVERVCETDPQSAFSALSAAAYRLELIGQYALRLGLAPSDVGGEI